MDWTNALDLVLLLRLIAAHILVDFIIGLDAPGRGSTGSRVTPKGAVLQNMRHRDIVQSNRALPGLSVRCAW
jgi:hypothetical protein